MAAEVGTAGAATLVVAWRTPRRVHGRVVKAGGAVEDQLRKYAGRAAEVIASGAGKSYDPGDEQGDHPYLSADLDELLDAAVVDVLSKGSSLSLATTDDLRRPLTFYALLLGDDPDRRSAFIKKGNPVKLAGKGLVALFDETLTRVTSPIFSFSAGYDVVVSPGGVWAFDQKNFEGLFKETDTVLAKTGEWVEQLSAAIPILEETMEEFAARLRTNSVLRRKVVGILRSSHIKSLTPDVLRAKMAAHGLDANKIMKGDELVFKREHESDLLHLLNEDLFMGDFSGEQYAAARKARR